MKQHTRRLAACLLCLTLLGSALSVSAAAPAPREAKGTVWTGHLWVEDTRVGLLNSQNRPVDPLEYQGTIYIPLRSAGAWMGCTVDWDQNTQTVTLTRGGTPQVVAVNDLPVRTDAESALHEQRLYKEFAIQVKPDITVILDGSAQHFTNAAGGAVYPVILDGVTYLPARSIGELMGKEVTWYEGPELQDHMDGVQIHATVTAAQKTELQAYVTQCRAVCDKFGALIEQLRSDDTAQVQAAYTAVKAALAELEGIPKPAAVYFTRCQMFLDAALLRAKSMVERRGAPGQGADTMTDRLLLPQELESLQAELPFLQGALDALGHR